MNSDGLRQFKGQYGIKKHGIGSVPKDGRD